MERYAFKEVWAIDVVNEFLSDAGTMHVSSPWFGIDDFLCKCFRWAKEANPDVVLWYNDFGHESTEVGYEATKSDAVFNLVKSMKERGDDCPVDAVGFESHIQFNWTY